MIYFLARWKHKFFKKNRHKIPFKLCLNLHIILCCILIFLWFYTLTILLFDWEIYDICVILSSSSFWGNEVTEESCLPFKREMARGQRDFFNLLLYKNPQSSLGSASPFKKGHNILGHFAPNPNPHSNWGTPSPNPWATFPLLLRRCALKLPRYFSHPAGKVTKRASRLTTKKFK